VKWDIVLTWKSNLFYSKYLENFIFDKMSKSIASHTPQWWDFLPRPNIMLYVEKLPHMLLVFYWPLSNFVDHCWEIYHTPKIKITYTPSNICYTSTPEVSKNMPFHFYQIKTPCLQTWSFSTIRANEAWAMKKKYWKEKKKRKMWKQEGP
jgi:hypothetical protein